MSDKKRIKVVIEATNLVGMKVAPLEDPREILKRFLEDDIQPRPSTPANEKSNKPLG